MTRLRLPVVATLATALVVTPLLTPSAAPSAASTALPAASTAPALAALGDVRPLGLDSRDGLPRLAPTPTQRAAADALLGRPGTTLTWNPRLGTPRTVHRAAGLTGASSRDSLAVARDWLAANRALLGLGSGQVSGLHVIRDHELPGGVATVLSFEQVFDGVEAAAGGVLTVVVDGDGRVVSYAGNPVRATGLANGFDRTAAGVLTTVVSRLAPGSGFVAVPTGETEAGYQVFEAGPFATVQRVRRVAFPTPDGARAAYAVLFVRSVDDAWLEVADATTGEPLYRKPLVAHSEGTVYENYPGAARGGRPVTRSFGPTPESPGGWVDPTGLAGLPGPTTLGNNANTFAQWSAPLAPSDEANRPVSPTSEFDYAFPESWTTTEGQTLPPSYADDRDAAVVNLFYHHNRIHDEYYRFGFTETGGNFQVDNFQEGGQGGDPVLGLAQSGAATGGAPTYLGRDNANMLTLPDGIPGLSSMYLWEPIDDAFEGPYRDGDFDATIIQHEYSHGLSNRYVGGGGLDSLGIVQSGAMGEGWGDWYAMNHLFREGLTRRAVTAPYVGDPERGIRNWSYDHNPTTYGDYGYDLGGPEVHSDGEIWTATLWDLRTAVLHEVGGDQRRASDVTEHLVTDAMPLSPPSPSFLDMRDAIVQAAELRYGDRFTDAVWTVFARRGMGVSARTEGETDTDPRPGFDHPVAARNGRLDVRLVNASAGGPVRGARLMIGEFEARATPVARTDRDGTASVRMVDGRYTLTVQADGYGIQHFPVTVRSGEVTGRAIRLRPNLASESAGAELVDVSSEDPGLPAEFLMDDSEASAWRTAAQDVAYGDGPRATATIRLAAPARVQQVAVSVMKPPTTPRFASASRVTIQASRDGDTWRTVQVARFPYRQPRPTVSDQNLKTYRLGHAVRARLVRVRVDAIHADTAETGSQAIVADLGVYGEARGVRPHALAPDAPVTESGTIAVGTAQGVLLLDGTEPYRPGVTTGAWTATCPDLPPSQDVDPHIIALPKGFDDGSHVVRFDGEAPVGELQLYFYDAACQPITGDWAVPGDSAIVPPAAAYAALLQVYGGGTTFELTAAEVR